MKTTLKYIEWTDPQELHEDTLSCISELSFAKDELQFLSDLMKSYTLDLLSKDSFDESKVIATDLSMLRKELKPLLKELKKHTNSLESLIDEVEVPGETKEYKDIHYKLMFEGAAYLTQVKKLKRRVFRLVKTIMQNKKKKILLNP